MTGAPCNYVKTAFSFSIFPCTSLISCSKGRKRVGVPPFLRAMLILHVGKLRVDYKIYGFWTWTSVIFVCSKTGEEKRISLLGTRSLIRCLQNHWYLQVIHYKKCSSTKPKLSKPSVVWKLVLSELVNEKISRPNSILSLN